MNRRWFPVWSVTCTPHILKTMGDVSGVFWCILCRSLQCFHSIPKVITTNFKDELAPETTLDFQTSFDLRTCWLLVRHSNHFGPVFFFSHWRHLRGFAFGTPEPPEVLKPVSVLRPSLCCMICQVQWIEVKRRTQVEEWWLWIDFRKALAGFLAKCSIWDLGFRGRLEI